MSNGIFLTALMRLPKQQGRRLARVTEIYPDSDGAPT